MRLDGTGRYAITGTGADSITGTDGDAITGTDSDAITGTGRNAITGTDADAITGTDQFAITGTGRYAITGTGAEAITGTDTDNLLALGRVDHVGDGFISVLGQTVLGSGAEFADLAPGATIAVYGAVDADSGGYVDTSVVAVAPAGVDAGTQDFLRGTVDFVDTSRGIAVVSGMTVDYTATLAEGGVPEVGQEFAVSGRNYQGLGVMVAE